MRVIWGHDQHGLQLAQSTFGFFLVFGKRLDFVFLYNDGGLLFQGFLEGFRSVLLDLNYLVVMDHDWGAFFQFAAGFYLLFNDLGIFADHLDLVVFYHDGLAFP